MPEVDPSSDPKPSQVEDWLIQSLSQDKRPLGLLIGAGCPQSIRITDGDGTKPLIPGIAQLTEEVVRSLAGGKGEAPLAILRKGLADDGRSKPTIEDLLTRLRTLADVAGKKKVRGLTASSIQSLERLIVEAVNDAVSIDLPAGQNPYRQLAAWVGSTARSLPVQIFTTNYDLLVEQALEDAGVPYFDGFVGSHEPRLDTFAIDSDVLPARWNRLWKLHGSTNWKLGSRNEVTRSSDIAYDETRLIHPSHLKYEESRVMPYLAMFDQLRAFLRMPSATLISTGYSFGDQHINALVANGLRGNSTAVTFGLLYGSGAGYTEAFALAESTPNLILTAANEICVGGRRQSFADPTNGEDTENSQDSSGDHVGDFAYLGSILENLLRMPIRPTES